MKKMLLIMSTSSFAILNFSTSIGALVMRDVVVDDTTVYDSVTLQLNRANGTFTVLDATLRDTTFENAVVDSVAESRLLWMRAEGEKSNHVHNKNCCVKSRYENRYWWIWINKVI